MRELVKRALRLQRELWKAYSEIEDLQPENSQLVDEVIMAVAAGHEDHDDLDWVVAELLKADWDDDDDDDDLDDDDDDDDYDWGDDDDCAIAIDAEAAEGFAR